LGKPKGLANPFTILKRKVASQRILQRKKVKISAKLRVNNGQQIWKEVLSNRIIENAYIDIQKGRGLNNN
jgi:hypothetical protein